MRPVSARATTPALSATRTARTLITTTRESTSDRSGGTRAASRVGASSGATGSASVVAHLMTSSTGIARPYSAGRWSAWMICARKIRLSSVHERARELAQPGLRHPARHPRGALAAVALLGEKDGGRSVARGEQLQERFLTGSALAPFASDQFLDGLEMVGKHLAAVGRAQD